MYTYKTIYIGYGGINYSFEIRLGDNDKVVYTVNERPEDQDHWDIISLAQVPDRVQMMMYQKLNKLIKQEQDLHL